MTAYNAAKHYQKVLRNVAEHYSLNDEDAQRMKDAITLHGREELADRYGKVPKVIWDNSSFGLCVFELKTDYGWIDLYEFGLKDEATDAAEPYHYGCLCFYD